MDHLPAYISDDTDSSSENEPKKIPEKTAEKKNNLVNEPPRKAGQKEKSKPETPKKKPTNEPARKRKRPERTAAEEEEEEEEKPKPKKAARKPKAKKVKINPGTARLRARREEFEGKTGVTGVDVGSENFAAALVDLSDGEVLNVVYESLKAFTDKEPMAFEYAKIMPAFMEKHSGLFFPDSIVAVEQQIVRNVNSRSVRDTKKNICGVCGVNKDNLCQICGNDRNGVGKFGADMPIITSSIIGCGMARGMAVELVVPANIKNRYDPGRTEKSHEINKTRVVEIVSPLLTEAERVVVAKAYSEKRTELARRGRALSGARYHDIYDAILIAWFVVEALTGRDVVKERREKAGMPSIEEAVAEQEDWGMF